MIKLQNGDFYTVTAVLALIIIYYQFQRICRSINQKNANRLQERKVDKQLGLLSRITSAIFAWCLIVSPIFFAFLNILCLAYITKVWKFYFIFVLWRWLPESFCQDYICPAFTWMRCLSICNNLSQYFPINILATFHSLNQLPNNQPPIFLYHPHGIFGLGCLGTFVTINSQCQKLFPGWTFRVATIDFNIHLPFLNFLSRILGMISCKKSSVKYALSRSDKSGVVVVLGGASEATLTHHTSHKVILRKRRGIFRIALETGAALIPVYAFGENQTYLVKTTMPNSFLHRMSAFTKHYFGFTTPVFYGRGIYYKFFGIFPLRQPITVVIGDPIIPPKVKSIHDHDITELQNKYCKALINLFDKYKYQTLQDPENAALQIVD